MCIYNNIVCGQRQRSQFHACCRPGFLSIIPYIFITVDSDFPVQGINARLQFVCVFLKAIVIQGIAFIITSSTSPPSSLISNLNPQKIKNHLYPSSKKEKKKKEKVPPLIMHSDSEHYQISPRIAPRQTYRIGCVSTSR